MELFESDWFFNLVAAQAKSPAARLTAVFGVASSWIAAPGIRKLLTQEAEGVPCLRLKDWLTEQARDAGAGNPAMLANQLLILLHGALAEEMRDPYSRALASASSAAQAVVSQACRKPFPSRWMAVAASLVAVISVAMVWQMRAPGLPTLVQARSDTQVIIPMPHPTSVVRTTGISPDELESLLVLQERIDRGICPPPNLLQLPEGQVTAYMNAIHFRVPENLEADEQNIRKFLAWFDANRATECYFKPKNGHTQTVWR